LFWSLIVQFYISTLLSTKGRQDMYMCKFYLTVLDYSNIILSLILILYFAECFVFEEITRADCHVI